MPRGKADAKPRGRMTAYAFFVQTCREEHKKKHPEETVVFAEFSRKCAERWKVCVYSELILNKINIVCNLFYIISFYLFIFFFLLILTVSRNLLEWKSPQFAIFTVRVLLFILFVYFFVTLTIACQNATCFPHFVNC